LFLCEHFELSLLGLGPAVKSNTPKEILTILYTSPSVTGEDKGKEKLFTDKDICKPFLLGICISDLFVNTVRPRDMYIYVCVSVLVEGSYLL
jgi:hypothetical protein